MLKAQGLQILSAQGRGVRTSRTHRTLREGPSIPNRAYPAPVLRRSSQVGQGSMLTIDSRITQIKAQGPSRACNESKEAEDDDT